MSLPNPKKLEEIVDKFDFSLAFMKNRPTFVPSNRGMEQLVARRAHNPKATGSSPVPATRIASYEQYGAFLFFRVHFID